MPSASAKLEKQASTEAVDPLRQAITVIEHKIRNLEKRKVKLEAYKEEQKNGKDLNSDQFSAVAKYDEVILTLDFARELNKNFGGIAADAAKALKKQQRKEQLERAQQEINRVKEILVIQEVLLNVGQDSVREDFLAAKNGAAQLTVEEIKYLDDLYLLLSPKHIPEENMPPYQEQLTHAAEHLINLVEGRSKEVVGTTYAGLKELITKIHTCGYFDQSPEEEEEVAVTEEVAEEGAVQQEEAPIEAYVDPCGVSQETLKANLVAAIPDVLPPQAPLDPSPVIPPEASFFTPAVPTSNVVPTNVSPDFPPHPAPSAPPMQQPVQGHALPDTFNSGFDFIQESQLEVDAPVPPHVDLAGMLVQQPGGGGQHPPVPTPHFRPARPGVPPPNTGAPAPPPPSVQTSQLAPVVAEFVASVSAATPPIPSQTFTNQNFSIIPVQGSAQPVVASPTPGIAPPNFPEASAPVSAQIVPNQQAAPNAQHIPGFARVPSNSFQGSVQSHSSDDSSPNPPISIPMPPQRVPEETEYAATSAAPFVPASVAQSTYSGQGQPSQAFVPQQQAMGQPRFANTYGDTSHVSATGDPSSEKARFGTTDLSAETTEEPDVQTSTSWADTSQEEVFVQQNQSQRGGGYGNRGGGRGGMNRGRGNSNGYSGRGRGNYSNGRGGYSGYRGNQEGGNQYYQNGYQQRDNYGNNSGGSGGGYGNGSYVKSGGRGGGSGGGASGNGGMPRTNRGRGGGPGRGANMRGGGRGGSYVRGGGNKQ